MDEATIDRLEEMLDQILDDHYYGVTAYEDFRENRKAFIRELIKVCGGGYSRPGERE